MSLSIGIVGVGGVGGYFGSKLCSLIHDAGARVYFVARGPHLAAIRRDGLSVKTAHDGDWTARPTLATDNFGDLPALDACLVCVKSYDLLTVAQQLRSCVKAAAPVVPLLNGIDIYERMRRELDRGLIYPACTYIGVHIAAPGKIYQGGGDCKILLGRDPRSPGFRPRLLFEMFKQCDIRFEWRDDIDVMLWRKYIFIAAFGMVMACFDSTLGQVLETPRLSRYVHEVMREIVAIAGGGGVNLPMDIVDETYRRGHDFAYESKTSFQRDFEKADKPDERDLFADTILRLGRQAGIETPATGELWKIMEERKRPVTGR
jgi:2-dehydropantoate 2-reductase